jgi:hypothetical protein
MLRIVSFAMEAIVGAMLQAFGMAEAKRRGYGEDGIYFDHPGQRPPQVLFWPLARGGLAWVRRGGKWLRKKVSGQTWTEVKDKLKAVHAELDAGVRTVQGYTVEGAVAGWPTACPAGPPRPSRSTGMRSARCSRSSGGSRCGT